MTKFYIGLFLLIHLSIVGQKLSTRSLISDLSYLNEAVLYGHPVNFNSQNQTSIKAVIEKAKQINTDSISIWEYTLWIEKGIYHIGCVHTSIQSNPLTINKKALHYIPLTASIQNNKLLITSCSDTNLIGQTIEKINGYSVYEIINNYREYKASDGKTNSFSLEYFHYASSKLISNFLNNPSLYTIQTSNGIVDLLGVHFIYLRKNEEEKTNNIVSNGKSYLYLNENFATLKINSFNKGDKRFLKSVFTILQEKKYENLILDLRQNTGGNRNSAIELSKYLIDTTFGYSILQPNLATKKYLNAKGKRFLFLSKLKYNLGCFTKGIKTEYGKEFIFNYTPKSNHFYKGKIYVLTDGFTASSSTMVTSWLKQFTNAIFIGKQASGGYNGNNGGSFPLITLPESKIEIKFPAYRLIFDKLSNQNFGIFPDFQTDKFLSTLEIIDIIQNQLN